MLLAKKDKDEQVLLAEDQAWMESRKASSSSADDKIFKVSYYLSESESEFEYETLGYYDNTATYENRSENDCQVVQKECDNMENSKVIAPGMFKLSVSQSVSPISVTKTSCDSNGVENLDTLSSVRRPKSNGVMWMRKGSSNTVKADFAFDCNNARMNASVDVNDLFVFDDVIIRKSHVNKMLFRKK
nr:hypothetical protein [Tanacetum cinerariifolium]